MKKGLTDGIKLTGYDAIFPPDEGQPALTEDKVVLLSFSDLYIHSPSRQERKELIDRFPQYNITG